MKIIKSVFMCTVMVISITISSKAQAQNRPDFCQIHIGNLSQYASQYDMINHSAPTPYRPFITNTRAYNINKELIAIPLYYFDLSNGNVGTAFQLKGKLGNLLIGNKDVVVQYIKYQPLSVTAEVIGVCVNGEFGTLQNQVYNLFDLPFNTQRALREANFGITQEQIGNAFR